MKKLRGILLSMTAVIVLLSLGGCGTKVNTKSPEKITKSLIEAYSKTDENAVKKCFGMDKKDKVSSELKTEIKHYMTLFEAYDAKSVKFTKCESLGSFNGYELMYAIYTLKKEDSESKTAGDSYLCLFTMFKITIKVFDCAGERCNRGNE